MLNLKEDLEILTNATVNSDNILPLVYLLLKDSEYKKDLNKYNRFYGGVKEDVKVQVPDNNAIRVCSERPDFEDWLARRVQP